MNRFEAHTLICSAQSGNTSARNDLIVYYCATLVPALASTWTRLSFEDAQAIGYLATVEAIDAALKTYDVQRPSGIAAYVRQTIVRQLSLANRHALAIHAPTKLGLRNDDIPRARIALDVMPTIADTTPSPEDLATQQQTRERLRSAFGRLLSARDARIMTALYFDDFTAEQVSQRFGVSEALIDSVRTTALRRLRHNSNIRAILAPSKPIRRVDVVTKNSLPRLQDRRKHHKS